MCSNKIQMCETKESDSNYLYGQENSANLLDLNQNHKNNKIHSPSPIHSSSSSVSSISPGDVGTTTHQPTEASLVPDINQHQASGYERPTEPFFPIPVNSSNGISPMDQYRLQFYNYAMVERLRNQNTSTLQHLYQPVAAYGSRLALSMSLFHNRVFQPEEPKPQHSYIGLIAMAILSAPDQKLVLSDIYQHILDNYPYFRSRGPGWRNSIRHNLSLNDCFIKSGRSANGKGHYWAIHPANIDDFKKGDFRHNDEHSRIESQLNPSKRINMTTTQEAEDEDIDVVANDDVLSENANHRRINSEIKSHNEDGFYANHRPSWNSIVQHLPLGINGMDPRIIGRCYGQYMAQHHVVNKRLFNSLSFNSSHVDEAAGKFPENNEQLIESGKRDVE
ncbi:CLUMA_CG002676, isoform A [Clunio marinus]|uniref:CLUMA_CG002676, isoform A n=1 Tax=Clunio marinus TaxID=568069 RepID=A0A1J1HR87_9DIPT|nr:CLUMA_CG002676, isoform A [Clunio marinus]